MHYTSRWSVSCHFKKKTKILLPPVPRQKPSNKFQSTRLMRLRRPSARPSTYRFEWIFHFKRNWLSFWKWIGPLNFATFTARIPLQLRYWLAHCNATFWRLSPPPSYVTSQFHVRNRRSVYMYGVTFTILITFSLFLRGQPNFSLPFGGAVTVKLVSVAKRPQRQKVSLHCKLEECTHWRRFIRITKGALRFPLTGWSTMCVPPKSFLQLSNWFSH